MENTFRQLSMNLIQLDPRYIRLVLILATLLMFVLGAGAPTTMGGPGG